MAKRKAAKAKQAVTKPTRGKAEPVVVELAARLGSILGRGAGRLSNLMPGKKTAAKKAKKSAAPAPASKGRSGGTVDAPGKRHRKPPPEELFDPRLGEPMGTQMGQKNFRRGKGDR